MGNRSLFPVVAVPLAFFCTLFFRHRKKSVSAPWDGQSQSAPESARQSPPRGFAYGKVVAYRCKQGAFRSPPAPLRIASEVNEYPMKVISPSLTPESARHSPSKGNFLGRGFSLRSKQGGFPLAPLHPLRIANRSNRAPLGTASPNSRRGEFLTAKLSFNEAMQGAFRSPPAPLRTVVGEKTHKSFPRGKQSARPSLSEPP